MKVELSDSNFDHEVIESDIPVMVHFTLGSAYDSKVEALIEELYPDYSGKLKFGRINISQNTSTAKRYGVSLSPNLLMFKSGKAVAQIPGVVPKEIIAAKLSLVIDTPLKKLRELRLRDKEKNRMAQSIKLAISLAVEIVAVTVFVVQGARIRVAALGGQGVAQTDILIITCVLIAFFYVGLLACRYPSCAGLWIFGCIVAILGAIIDGLQGEHSVNVLVGGLAGVVLPSVIGFVTGRYMIRNERFESGKLAVVSLVQLTMVIALAWIVPAQLR